MPINLSMPIKGGGGGGFRPIILETFNIRYGLKGKARTHTSEQKWGQTPKSVRHSIRLVKTSNLK